MRETEEQRLLADIEDAKYDVALYDRVMHVLGLVAVGSLAVFVAGILVGALSVGSGVDLGALAAALIFPAVFIGPGALAGLWWWFFTQNTRKHTFRDDGLHRPWTGGPKQRLRAARRAHEQWLMARAS